MIASKPQKKPFAPLSASNTSFSPAVYKPQARRLVPLNFSAPDAFEPAQVNQAQGPVASCVKPSPQRLSPLDLSAKSLASGKPVMGPKSQLVPLGASTGFVPQGAIRPLLVLKPVPRRLTPIDLSPTSSSESSPTDSPKTPKDGVALMLGGSLVETPVRPQHFMPKNKAPSGAEYVPHIVVTFSE